MISGTLPTQIGAITLLKELYFTSISFIFLTFILNLSSPSPFCSLLTSQRNSCQPVFGPTSNRTRKVKWLDLLVRFSKCCQFLINFWRSASHNNIAGTIPTEIGNMTKLHSWFVTLFWAISVLTISLVLSLWINFLEQSQQNWQIVPWLLCEHFYFSFSSSFPGRLLQTKLQVLYQN